MCLATSYKLMSSYLCSHGYSHEQYSGSCTNQEKNPKRIVLKTWTENNTMKTGITSSTLSIQTHLSRGAWHATLDPEVMSSSTTLGGDSTYKKQKPPSLPSL